MALTDNLIAYYKFNNNTEDELGLNDATNNGATSATGKINNGYLLTTGENDFINFPNDFLGDQNTGTISLWFKAPNFTSPSLIFCSSLSSGSDLFRILTSDAGIIQIQRYRTTGGAINNNLNGSIVLSSDEWHHIVVCSDGNDWFLYVDGVLDTLTPFPGTNTGEWFGDLGGTQTVDIGRNFIASVAYYSNTFNIDELGVWSRVLELPEILQLFNLGNGLTYPFIDTVYSSIKLRTRLTINGTEYFDAQSLKITKTIGVANLSSNFTIVFNSPYGRYKNTFNINDEVVFYAEKSNLYPTQKLIRGIIEKIKFTGNGLNQKITLYGRDYSARLQDITVEPIVFNNMEISQIVINILTNNNVPDITTNNVNATSITLPRIRYNHDSIFDALNQLAELAGYNWYVDVDKDLHFEQKKTISSGYTLNSATNILSSDFDRSRQGMANRIWVYGDRYLSGFTEKHYIGSPTGQSGLTLIYKPHNTEVTYLGSSYKGGVFGFTITPTSGTNYLVDYDNKAIIFQSGTSIGYNSIPISGGSVIVNYQIDLPVAKFGQDDTSIRLYGPKNLVIQDESIKDPDFALSTLKNKLQETSPLNRLKLNLHGWFDFNSGETVDVVMDEYSIDEDDISIIQVDYKFDSRSMLEENVISVTLSKKFLDITDQIKSLSERLSALESKNVNDSDVITRLLVSQEQFTVVGSCWNVFVRTNLGSSFILGKGYHGITGTTFGGILGSIIESGVNFLGDSRSSLQILYSGGNNYSITGSYDPEAPETGGGFGILGKFG